MAEFPGSDPVCGKTVTIDPQLCRPDTPGPERQGLTPGVPEACRNGNDLSRSAEKGRIKADPASSAACGIQLTADYELLRLRAARGRLGPGNCFALSGGAARLVGGWRSGETRSRLRALCAARPRASLGGLFPIVRSAVLRIAERIGSPPVKAAARALTSGLCPLWLAI